MFAKAMAGCGNPWNRGTRLLWIDYNFVLSSRSQSSQITRRTTAHSHSNRSPSQVQMIAWERILDPVPRRPPGSFSVTGELTYRQHKVTLADTSSRWYFSQAYADPQSNPGEAVWLRNQINVLYEMGYTVLATNSYAGMVQGHAALPDVISLIWTEDKHTLTCQDDPRCALFSEFKPTNEKYPGTDVRPDHTSSIWDDIPEDADKRPAQRWAWTWPELDALPKEERGTIPVWKLFTTTYVSRARRQFDMVLIRLSGEPGQMIRSGTLLSRNSRGTRTASNGRSRTFISATLDGDALTSPFRSPFDYPDHSYIPYSMERDCMKTRFADEEMREDRLFILAKSTEYFNEPFTGIPRSFWSTLIEMTNLTAYSTAEDDPNLMKDKEVAHVFGVPEGIESLGLVSKAEFEVQLARAKLMLGLGRPYISPSVYSAL